MRKLNRRITVSSYGRELVHVETPLGLVNIWCDLTDEKGHRVNTIMISPNNMVGEKRVTLDGHRLIEDTDEEFEARRIADHRAYNKTRWAEKG